MKKSNIPIFIILTAILVVSGFFIFINKAQAETLYVCPEVSGECTYDSIQDAIDVASPGDIINVAAGTYNENITIPNTMAGAGLQLLGAGKTSSIIFGTIAVGTSVDNPVMPGVTIQGFGFNGDNTADYAISIRASGDSEAPGVIADNSFENFRFAISVSSNGHHYWDIKNNEFDGNRLPMYIIGSYYEISNNVFENYKEAVSGDWDYGAADHLTIKDNQFLGGIHVMGADLNPSTVAQQAAVLFSSYSHDVSVTGNEITSTTTGVLVKHTIPDNEADLSNVVVNLNNIVGNTNSVVVEGTPDAVLDVTNNWWGAATGPNTAGADSIEGDVDFAPYYTDVAMTVLSTEYSVCDVGCNFINIQDAIDAATSGDTINVEAGVYAPTSTININKNDLNLLGPQADVDPRPSQDSTRSVSSAEEAIIDGGVNGLGVIIEIDAENVVINGLEIKSGTGDMIKQNNPHSGTQVKYSIIHDGLGDEGVQLKQCTSCVLEYNYVFEIADPGDGLNIADNSSHGIIRYNEITGIHGENAAIYIYDAEYMEISNNLVRDSGAGGNDGIKVGSKSGSDALKIDVLIKDNIIHDITQDGISVYMSEVTVERNEIYNCGSENGAIYIAFAVFDITITGNTVHDNTLDIGKWGDPGAIMIGTAVDASTISVNLNNIYGNSPNGVTNKTSFSLDAINNYWGHSTGPGEVASGSGDAITVNVEYFPWYANSEMTSLRAPTTTDPVTGDTVLELEQPIDIISNDITVSMPAEITITATASWEGIIDAPSIETVVLDTPPPESGYSTVVDTIIEVGYSNIKLVFNKAVRILIPNQAGKRVGYVRPSEDFQEITSVCLDNTQATNDLLPPEGDCKRDVDNDLAVWTKHFTQFIVYSYSSIPEPVWGGFRASPEPEPEEEPSVLSEEAQKLDINKDDKIDDSDLKELFANWGSIILDNIADFNDDSKVDIFDFNLLMIHWTE